MTRLHETKDSDFIRITKLIPITSTIKSKVKKFYGHTKLSTLGKIGKKKQRNTNKTRRYKICHSTGPNQTLLSTGEDE